MDAVTYDHGRPATAGRPETRTTVFARFMDALKESRARAARLVIARYAHLLATYDPELEQH
ncbi:MAG TPA: hypothetical protein VKP52_03670 [Pseudolabrys sp.]|jgi:hypothetical protein|nr:hypothetical protein [Pseudolabrys sp.]